MDACGSEFCHNSIFFNERYSLHQNSKTIDDKVKILKKRKYFVLYSRFRSSFLTKREQITLKRKD